MSLTCEQHPESEWPHDDCAGPGALVFAPHIHKHDEQGFCQICRMTRADATKALTLPLARCPRCGMEGRRSMCSGTGKKPHPLTKTEPVDE